MMLVNSLVIFFTLLAQTGWYTNPVEGYSIQFPTGWSVVEDRQHIPAYTGAYSPKTNPAHYGEIKIVVLPNMPASYLTSAMQDDIELARNVSDDVKIERNQAITVGGVKGQVVQLTLTSPKLGLIRLINYGFAKNNRLYFIHCFGNQAYFQQSANQVQKACLTFRIQ
jgi:hypothetical protein